MHYTEEITIAAPREKVVRLFTDPTHFTDWQPGLESYDLITGEQAQTGTKAELVTRVEGGREMCMVETVENNSLPDSIDVIYESEGVWNRNANRFVAETPDTTRWISENEFRFEGLRLGLELLAGSFKNESMQTMERFKAFVEHADG